MTIENNQNPNNREDSSSSTDSKSSNWIRLTEKQEEAINNFKAKTKTIDFTTYIMSLGQTIQVALGDLPNPETGTRSTDLAVARQFIDILAILHEKTLGNLSSDETKLIEALLFELRLKYVSRCKCCNKCND